MDARRRSMVDRDIVARGVAHPGVLEAMVTVPRHRFVQGPMSAAAYQDRPLPIGSGQTISQPYVVALMAEAVDLGPDDRVLEVGAGSGYGAAVLSRVAAEVWTIERHGVLAERARRVLAELGYDNVHVRTGDGTQGAPDVAPFDAIVVTAAGPAVPQALVDQLVDGGRLVMPVGPDGGDQELRLIRRHGEHLVERDLGPVRFVPLIGDEDRPDVRSS